MVSQLIIKKNQTNKQKNKNKQKQKQKQKQKLAETGKGRRRNTLINMLKFFMYTYLGICSMRLVPEVKASTDFCNCCFEFFLTMDF